MWCSPLAVLNCEAPEVVQLKLQVRPSPSQKERSDYESSHPKRHLASWRLAEAAELQETGAETWAVCY
jgi:hypothetical protein